jgi:hypothetical protein
MHNAIISYVLLVMMFMAEDVKWIVRFGVLALGNLICALI